MTRRMPAALVSSLSPHGDVSSGYSRDGAVARERGRHNRIFDFENEKWASASFVGDFEPSPARSAGEYARGSFSETYMKCHRN